MNWTRDHDGRQDCPVANKVIESLKIGNVPLTMVMGPKWPHHFGPRGNRLIADQPGHLPSLIGVHCLHIETLAP